MTSIIELKAREQWLVFAVDQRYGRCERCGRVRNEEGKPLYVVRQSRSRRYICLPCWDGTR